MTTYTQSLRLANMTPGDPAVRDQWGTIWDATVACVDQAAAGTASIDITGLASYALTVSNNAPDQARQMSYPFVGTLGAPCTITLPQVPKVALVQNLTTGGQIVTLTTGATGGRTVAVLPGLSSWVTTDGTHVDLPVMAGAVPIGALQTFAGAAAPPRWLVCNGQAVSRTVYALLFAVVGTAYGPGDGTSTFNVPDLRGRSMFGLDNMGGTPAGRVTGQSGMAGGTLGAAGGDERLQSHTHNVSDPGHAHGVNDPSHAHGVADPGHAHGAYANVSDPGHGHGVNDPGHAHAYDDSTISGSGYIAALGSPSGYGVGSSPHPTYPAGTSISIQGSGSNIGVSVGTYGAGTGIGIYGSYTGISIQAALTGISVNATGAGGSQNMPPAMLVNILIYAGI